MQVETFESQNIDTLRSKCRAELGGWVVFSLQVNRMVYPPGKRTYPPTKPLLSRWFSFYPGGYVSFVEGNDLICIICFLLYDSFCTCVTMFGKDTVTLYSEIYVPNIPMFFSMYGWYTKRNINVDICGSALEFGEDMRCFLANLVESSPLPLFKLYSGFRYESGYV